MPSYKRQGPLWVPERRILPPRRRYRPTCTIAFDAAANAGTGAASATTLVTTVAPAAGAMMAGVGTFGSATTSVLSSITDNGTGGTWVIVRRIADASNGATGFSSYGYGWSVMPTTVTLNFSSSMQYRGFSVLSFTGQATGDPIDGTNEQGQLQATPGLLPDGAKSGAGTQTPGANNYLVFGGSVDTAGLNAGGVSFYTAGTSFTEPAGAEHQTAAEVSLSSEYWIQTTATAANASFTLLSNRTHITFQIIFKILTAGGTVVPQIVNGFRQRA